MGRTTVFGVNNDSGYNWSVADNRQMSAEVARSGLEAVRMGMDDMECETPDDACSWKRDPTVDLYTSKGIRIHAVVSFRHHVSPEGGHARWAANFASFCSRMAAHYRGKIFYYIVDNEPDVSYGPEERDKVSPAVAVRMQKACYDAVKAVDPSIRVESSPTASPDSEYLRDLLKAGIADFADVIGVHMYGGQLDSDAISTTREYMREARVDPDTPIACSECGSSTKWYTKESPYKGKAGTAARAQWLRDFADYCVAEKLDNCLFFSTGGVSGADWEINDPAGRRALYDIGHSG